MTDAFEDALEEKVGPQEAHHFIELPKYTNWSVSSIYDFENQVTDYNTLAELETSIRAARIALFKTTDKLNKAERQESKHKLIYARKYRREFLQSQEKTQEARKIRAELRCEEEENEWLKWSQLTKELVRLSNALRTELQSLQTTANNLRQQMRDI